MAERLTKKISKTIQDKYSLGQYLYYDFAGLDDINKLLNKLGKLEDILEKYGVDIQNLDYILEDYSKNQGRDFAICEEIDDLKKDRDTWQKACESMAFNYDKKLTCNTCYIKEQCSKQYGGNYEQALCNYFYQQAKKEGENNDTNN